MKIENQEDVTQKLKGKIYEHIPSSNMITLKIRNDNSFMFEKIQNRSGQFYAQVLPNFINFYRMLEGLKRFIQNKGSINGNIKKIILGQPMVFNKQNNFKEAKYHKDGLNDRQKMALD